jgi:hypothetical protein
MGGRQATPTHVIRDLDTIDAELQWCWHFAVRLGSAVGRCRR